jgi:PAS domain S-box-containing protein
MRVRGPVRSWVRYVVAVAISVTALGVLHGINAAVGFVPLLLLPVVALVERYVGPGPATLATAVCTLGSLAFVSEHGLIDERLHNITKLALFPAVASMTVYLMEARRKQRRVVQEQLLELSTLLESLPEAVFIFDSNGRLADVNHAAEQLCDYRRAELVGTPYPELARLLSVHREDRPLPPAEMAVARVLHGESIRNEPRMLVHPRDRSDMHMMVTASPMRNEQGAIIGALLVLRDVTEITKLQRQIADTERHLAIGQMASGIAHDFNNVLNTITQAVALLEMRPDQSASERKAYLDMIDRAARTGSEIIRRVREYVRGGSGQTEPVDVARALQEALDLTRPLWRKVNGLTVERDLKWVGMVRANRADLQRVFTNLIINAIQAMPEGGRLRLECEQREGNILVRVRDTGLGITAEQARKIFLPYYTTKPQGTGLGLSMAQKMLLAHGGNISFTSDPGKDTTFTVELPAISAQAENAEQPARVA